MEFTLVSFFFFIFFIISVIIYYLIPKKFQWRSLLVFGLVFFMLSSIKYTIVYLLASALLTFLSTSQMSKASEDNPPKKWLIIGIVGNLAILAILKYIAFVLSNINAVARIAGGIPTLIELPAWAAPIGISFYTLSAIGYIADCYWGVCEPTGSFFKDLLFISYWPILTSGPILKHSVVTKELYSEHRFDINRISSGAQRMLWGISKKIVISSRLGMVVDTIYADPETYHGFYIWIAAVMFMLQLYTDFSGCMDIAIGASECYGIALPENFRRPFFSKSLQEFWQRWHITLGGWYREYILYPLLNTKWLTKIEKDMKKKHGRKYGRTVSSCIGMLFVWFLFGLWHGGQWKFVLMGLFFWAIIVFETITNGWFNNLWKTLEVPTDTGGWKFLQCCKVFIIVTIGNMFFRLDSIKATFTAIRLGFNWNPWIFFDDSLFQLGLARKDFTLTIVCLCVLLIVSLIQRKGSVRELISRQPLIIKVAIYSALIFVPLFFGMYGTGYDAKAFIYEVF